MVGREPGFLSKKTKTHVKPPISNSMLHAFSKLRSSVMIQHSLRSQPSFPPENPKKVLFSHNDVPLPRFPSIKKKTTSYTFLVVKSPVMSGVSPRNGSPPPATWQSLTRFVPGGLPAVSPWVKDRWLPPFHRTKNTQKLTMEIIRFFFEFLRDLI